MYVWGENATVRKKIAVLAIFYCGCNQSKSLHKSGAKIRHSFEKCKYLACFAPSLTIRLVPIPAIEGMRWLAKSGASRRIRDRPTAATDARL